MLFIVQIKLEQISTISLMPLIHGIDIINIWNFDLSLELDNTWFYTPYTILIDVDKKIGETQTW